MTIQRLLVDLHRLLSQGLLDKESEIQVNIYEARFSVKYVGAGTESKCLILHAQEEISPIDFESLRVVAMD